MDIYLAKTMGGALMPLDSQGQEYVQSLAAGEVVRAAFKKDRSPGHHRKFFGILRLVFENQDKYLSEEGLRFAVMIAAGYADQIALEGDKVAFRPVSINWATMDQLEFEKFYKAALAAIPRLLPEFEGIDLDRELAMVTT
jgi:Protein of unknown function (DUF1367)